MHLPTAVKALINKCKCLGDQNDNFKKKDSRLFLIAMIENLQDRLPLKNANHKDLCILKFENF